jgi:hypothetical protein
MSTNDSTPAVLPTKLEVDAAVYAAFVADGYVMDDGAPDKAKVREHMLELLRPRKVTSWAERGSKAVTRGEMVKTVFPSLPGPDLWADQPNPALAEKVWSEIDSYLWTETRPSSTSALQRLVGFSMGNGYVLCRAKIGDNRTNAVYVTDNRQCIDRDYVKAEVDALERMVGRLVGNREMLIIRQPEHGAHYLRAFNTSLKHLQLTGASRLQQALMAATAEDEDVEDAEDGAE